MMKRFFVVALMVASCIALANAQKSDEYKIKTIVLDAGHGGHDTGCRGVSSYEKDVTLAVVLKLGEMIKAAYPDVKVIYTRKTDEFIELYERASIANRNNADLFISIHCNASKSHDPNGTETWCMGLHKSEGNLEVSKRENDVILLEDNYQENYIILSMNQNAHLEQSIGLASKIENEFTSDGRPSRGVKQAGFLVLWRTTMPAILIETGFLTNRTEEKYLASATGQKEIANSVLKAISIYKSEVEGTGGVPIADYSLMKSVEDSSLKINSGIIPPAIAGKDSTIPEKSDAANKDQLIYRIQIAASEKPINLKESKYSSLAPIKNDKSDKGLNRYVSGNFTSLQECENELTRLKAKGFKDAFIVAYKFEARVPLPKK
jgi:N-acetylmuramoyl-L-alanine amidase